MIIGMPEPETYGKLYSCNAHSLPTNQKSATEKWGKTLIAAKQ